MRWIGLLILFAAGGFAGRSLVHALQHGASAGERSSAASLEGFLANHYGERWERARERLLAEGTYVEEELARPFDAGSLAPWESVRSQLSEWTRRPLDGMADDDSLYAHLRESLCELPQPKRPDQPPGEFRAVEYTGPEPIDFRDPLWNKRGRPLSEDEATWLHLRTDEVLAEMAERAERAADLLEVAIEDAWRDDRFLRWPSQVGPSADRPERGKPVHESETVEAPIRGMLSLDGWTVLVSIDLADAPDLAAVCEEIHAIRDGWVREVHTYIQEVTGS